MFIHKVEYIIWHFIRKEQRVHIKLHNTSLGHVKLSVFNSGCILMLSTSSYLFSSINSSYLTNDHSLLIYVKYLHIICLTPALVRNGVLSEKLFILFKNLDPTCSDLHGLKTHPYFANLLDKQIVLSYIWNSCNILIQAWFLMDDS
jgi:hypothetical protein